MPALSAADRPARLRALPAVQTLRDDAAQEPLYKALLSVEQLVDAVYPNADALVASQPQGINWVEPMTTKQRWQQRAQAGFASTSVERDWDQQVARRPNDQQSGPWSQPTLPGAMR